MADRTREVGAVVICTADRRPAFSAQVTLVGRMHGAARGATVLTPSLAPKLFRARAVDTPLLSAGSARCCGWSARD